MVSAAHLPFCGSPSRGFRHWLLTAAPYGARDRLLQGRDCMRNKAVADLLARGLNPYEQRLNARLIEALAAGFRRRPRAAGRGAGPEPLPDLLRFLHEEID